MVAVGIIGAGVSGLTAAKVLKDHGFKNIVIFERSSTFGGVWNTSYRNARLQQRKDDFFLSGCEWPKNTAEFPSCDDVLSYLRNFVECNQLTDLVRFNVDIKDCQHRDGKWTLTLADGQVESFDQLIVATGALGRPRMEVVHRFVSAGFEGPVVHSSQYYDPAPFAGKRVLVVGSGSSAVEVCVDLARTARSVTMSARHGVEWIFPRHGLFGEPLRMCDGGSYTPMFVRNILARLLFFVKFGNLQRFDMQPPHGPLDSRLIASDEFYTYLDHQMIKVVRSGVAKVCGQRVTFENDEEAEYDAVVTCTGFEPPACQDTFLGDMVSRVSSSPSTEMRQLYKTVFHPELPNCAFLGLTYGFVAIPRVAELQASFVANVMKGRVQLPDSREQKAFIARRVADPRAGGTTNNLTANRFYRELQAVAYPENSRAFHRTAGLLLTALLLCLVGGSAGKQSNTGHDAYGMVALVATTILVILSIIIGSGVVKVTGQGMRDREEKPTEASADATGTAQALESAQQLKTQCQIPDHANAVQPAVGSPSTA